MKSLKMALVGLFFAAIFVGSLIGQTKVSDARLRKELIGIWHASPSVAAGMNDLYRFDPNGRFSFENNQMVWSKRTISTSGKWGIEKGKLILIADKKRIVVGGKKVKSDASGSADGFEIKGGKTLTRSLHPAKIEVKKLGKIQQDEPSKRITIGGVKFWRLSSNPKEYS